MSEVWRMDAAIVVVVVVLVGGAVAAIVKRGWIKARFGSADGLGVEVSAGREQTRPPHIAGQAAVRDAESSDGRVTAAGPGEATVERARAQGDITADATGAAPDGTVTDPKA